MSPLPPQSAPRQVPFDNRTNDLIGYQQIKDRKQATPEQKASRDKLELNVKEKLLEVEYRLAELAEKVDSSGK